MMLSDEDQKKIEEIRAAIKIQVAKRDDATAEIRALIERRKAVQARCTHPNIIYYTVMGDPSGRCPDCDYGW